LTASPRSRSSLVTLAKSKLHTCIGYVIPSLANPSTSIPLNLWRADHWYNKPSKKAARPSKEDYTYYFKHNVHITTSGNFSTQGLKFCINELGADRCLYSIGKPPEFFHDIRANRIDTPYDSVEDGQAWWRTVDLADDVKWDVGRNNAIRLFKLPLEI